MKQKIKLFTFTGACCLLIITSLYAGKDSRDDCDKCHFYSNGQMISQSDPFLKTINTQLTKK